MLGTSLLRPGERQTERIATVDRCAGGAGLMVSAPARPKEMKRRRWIFEGSNLGHENNDMKSATLPGNGVGVGDRSIHRSIYGFF